MTESFTVSRTALKSGDVNYHITSKSAPLSEKSDSLALRVLLRKILITM